MDWTHTHVQTQVGLFSFWHCMQLKHPTLKTYNTHMANPALTLVQDI